jgi:hypothetical protein
MAAASAPSPRIVLVVSGTSKQGRALIDQLVEEDSQSPGARKLGVYALTRSPESESARRLLAISAVERVVGGDLNDPGSLRRVFEEARPQGGIKAVFAVLPFPGLGKDTEPERKQGQVGYEASGKAGSLPLCLFLILCVTCSGTFLCGQLLADLSLEYGVEHFVYSSADRGGEDTDDDEDLDKKAASKVAIERHIKTLGEKGLNWTSVVIFLYSYLPALALTLHRQPRILRPTIFMENFIGIIGRITATVFKACLKEQTKIRLTVNLFLQMASLYLFA